jgi:hypothetical protein
MLKDIQSGKQIGAVTGDAVGTGHVAKRREVVCMALHAQHEHLPVGCCHLAASGLHPFCRASTHNCP